MVSAKFDNTPKIGQQQRTGSLVLVVVLLAWVAIVVAIGSIWWNDRSSMTGSQWAARAANGAAICLAVIYATALFLMLWLLTQWFVYHRWVKSLVIFCIGIAPAVLTLWGFLEGKLSPESKFHIATPSLTTRLVDLDELAHIRLLGGSLWQTVQAGSAVKIINPSPLDAENRVLSDLDAFILQIRDAIGSHSNDLVYIHFKPLSAVAVADSTNWIAFDKPIRNADSITQNVWLNCAEATLRGDIAGNANPPSVLTAGYSEYFSRNTDEIMDDYFDAASKLEFMSKLSDLTTDSNYAQNTHEHHLVGGAFLTYLVEELQSHDFLSLCEVKDREQFEANVQSKFGKAWSEVCDGFEQWLVVEADRLGWKHNQPATPNHENLAHDEAATLLSRIKLSDSNLESAWRELTTEAMPIHQARSEADVDFGVEIKTKYGENMKDSSVEFDQLLRALKDHDNRWYSAVDQKGELSLALSIDDSVRAERLASKLLRQTYSIPSQIERERAKDKVDRALNDWRLHGDFIASVIHYLNQSESWTLRSLTGEGLQNPKTIELQSNQDVPINVRLVIDPNMGYRVTDVDYVNGKETEKIELDYIPFNDDFVIATEKKAVAEKKTSLATIHSVSKFHVMSQNEGGSFREELAYMKKINIQPQSQTTSIPMQLLRMMFAVFFSATGIGALTLLMKA